MKKLTLLLVFISTLTFAQEKIITKLGDFNTLKVYNGLTVELKKGESSRVEITGSQSKDVSIKNSNGILKELDYDLISLNIQFKLFKSLSLFSSSAFQFWFDLNSKTRTDH